jgi:hypothetical protein
MVRDSILQHITVAELEKIERLQGQDHSELIQLASRYGRISIPAAYLEN